MFAGKYLLYEVQCMKHEHSIRILCVYCSELRLLVICSACSRHFSRLGKVKHRFPLLSAYRKGSFCFFASLMFILSQKRCKISK